ncbi:hypothetical protein PMAYCL1PPCAC_26766, partial [Pristionchus mayeri]
MENPAFAQDEEANKRKQSTLPTTMIDIPEPSCCCSWTRLCDVMGNRQNLFIQNLRPMKIPLIHTTQKLASLQMELERGMRTFEETVSASNSVHHLIKCINTITTDSILNVPPDENEMLRQCAKDLSVLARVVDQLVREDKIYRQSLRDAGKLVEEAVTTSAPASPTEESSFEFHGRQMRHTASGSAVDEHSLKERITRISEMLEKLLKFVDKKTERRWWLRDVINFAQLVVKVALFISASIAVFYPAEQIFPIITLALTIAQGVIEVMDQYFLKNTTPEDIKMHVVTTLSAASG